MAVAGAYGKKQRQQKQGRGWGGGGSPAAAALCQQSAAVAAVCGLLILPAVMTYWPGCKLAEDLGLTSP